jgi:peptidoglycan/xylan/chitin deacetylase (PgdA/CDA1 family)
LPQLLERGIPCTYFVNTHNAQSREPFAHDVRMGNRFAPNTVRQLQELAAAGIELGGHTRSHADLGAIHNDDALYDEVVAATRELEQAVGVGIRYFAFPFGQHSNLNARAFQLAREAGFEAVCSAYGGCNFPGDDPFHIQRISGEGPLLRLKSWLTLDPRRLRSVRRFDYKAAPKEQLLRPAAAGVAAP